MSKRSDYNWSNHAIDEALLAFEVTDGFDVDKMKAALYAAAEVSGLNGPKRRLYRKMKPLLEDLPDSAVMRKYREIVREELENYDLIWDYLLYGGQMRLVVDCRWTIMWRLKNETSLSYSAIGRLLKCDHSTVMNACERMDDTEGNYFKNRPIAESTLKQNRARMRKIDARLEVLDVDESLEDIAA